MLTVYVVLDGFDFGAGIVAPPRRAQTDDERRTVLGRDRPGLGRQRGLADRLGRRALLRLPARLRRRVQRLLPAADDRALAAHPARARRSSSASQWDNPLWRAFWDASFAFSSTVLALVLGVALGNVVRGVPLDADGELHRRRSFGDGGALDALHRARRRCSPSPRSAAHGATYLAWKCDGDVCTRAAGAPLAPRAARRRRARRRRHAGDVARAAGAVVVVRAAPVGVAAAARRRRRARASPGARRARRAIARVPRDLGAVWWRCSRATAASLYPVILRSTIDARFDVTAPAAATGHHGLAVGPHLVAARARPRRRLFRLPVSLFCGEGASVSPLTRASAAVTARTNEDVRDRDGDVALVVPAQDAERDLAAQRSSSSASAQPLHGRYGHKSANAMNAMK